MLILYPSWHTNDKKPVAAFATSDDRSHARSNDTDAICTPEEAPQYLRFFHHMKKRCDEYRKTGLKSEEYQPTTKQANWVGTRPKSKFYAAPPNPPFYDIFERDKENRAKWRVPPVGTRPSCAWIILMITGGIFTPEERHHRYPHDFTPSGHIREDRLPCGRTPVVLMNGLPHIASYNGYYLLTGSANFPWLIDRACHSDHKHDEIVLGQAILGPRLSNEILHLDIRLDEQTRREIIVSNIHDLALLIDEQDIILASPVSCEGWRTRLTPKSDTTGIHRWQLPIEKDREAEVSKPYDDILSSELLPKALNFRYPQDMEGYNDRWWEISYISCDSFRGSTSIQGATKRPGDSIAGLSPDRVKRIGSTPPAAADDPTLWTGKRRSTDPLTEPVTKRTMTAASIPLPQADELEAWEPVYPRSPPYRPDMLAEELFHENMDEKKVFANAKILLNLIMADAHWIVGVHQSCTNPVIVAEIANDGRYHEILRRQDQSIEQVTAMAEALSEEYKSDLMKHIQSVLDLLDLIGATFRDTHHLS